MSASARTYHFNWIARLEAELRTLLDLQRSSLRASVWRRRRNVVLTPAQIRYVHRLNGLVAVRIRQVRQAIRFHQYALTITHPIPYRGQTCE